MDSQHASVAVGELPITSINTSISVCTPTPIAQLCMTQYGTNVIGSACLSTNVIPGINAQVCVSTNLPQQGIDNLKFLNDYLMHK